MTKKKEPTYFFATNNRNNIFDSNSLTDLLIEIQDFYRDDAGLHRDIVNDGFTFYKAEKIAIDMRIKIIELSEK